MPTELLITGPTQPVARFLCAHGAGGAMTSPFLETMAKLLAERGIATIRFEFAYESIDKELPAEITLLPSGEERFRRYIPFKNFVNTIEDYPYPYVIGKLGWEVPCMVPSDWESFNVQGPNAPAMLEDWKAAQEHLSRATTLDPSMAASWWALGAAQMEDGILDEAERNVKWALRLRDSSHFRRTLALILMKRGKLGEAEQVHLQGLELKPESHERWESYACFLEDLRRQSEAEVAYQKARLFRGN